MHYTTSYAEVLDVSYRTTKNGKRYSDKRWQKSVTRLNPFLESRKKVTGIVHRLLKDGAPGDRLFKTLREPYFYSCSAARLKLPLSCAHPEGIFDPVMVRRWLRQVAQLFEGPLFVVLEVGNERTLQAHIIAEKYAGLTHLARDTQAIKPVYDVEGLLRYLHKALPETPELVAAYTRATLSGRRIQPRRWFWLDGKRKGL